MTEVEKAVETAMRAQKALDRVFQPALRDTSFNSDTGGRLPNNSRGFEHGIHIFGRIAGTKRQAHHGTGDKVQLADLYTTKVAPSLSLRE